MITDDLERLAERGPHHDPADVVASAVAESDTARAKAKRTRTMAIAAASVVLIAGVVVVLVVRSGADPGGVVSSPTVVESETLLPLSLIAEGDDLVVADLPDGWEIDDPEFLDGIIKRAFRDPARDAAGSVSVGFGNVDRVEPDGELRRLGGVDWFVTVNVGRSTTYMAVGDNVFLLVGGSGFDPAELDQFVASLRASRPNEQAGRPDSDDVDDPPSNLSLLDAVRPSQEYFVAVWDAREVVIGECMNRRGFDYRSRPNDAAATGGTWDDWNQWKNEQTASHPSFESAFQGRPDAQAGGCQLEAYLAVHGPGEEAYSKAATLENELRARSAGLDLDQTTVDRWVVEHAEEVDRVHAELDEELQTARRIIQNSTP